ncbi:MAG: UDP-N-acetylmuramoyl-L-alanyl-D-glutamate--2,6-diaminopimelate ligase [Betaproteobacteria bacterium HGW-Betaproteobacteria-11]|nr:MAG: UDP-N-acetylmuramoyl-L-alanyl-D-glutamate--2,6-diaminopimelate ligase [Betaproteobacteria bacterium HGW-Betaproteobacteria-11]
MDAAGIFQALAERGIRAKSLVADSRRVASGDVFLACPGHHVDGRSFIAEAVARGAAAVIMEAGPGMPVQVGGTPCLAVKNLAAAIGALADRVYGAPSSRLWLAGVTGTNGKTSVSQWLAQAMNRLGHRCALVGTLGNGFPGALEPTGFTTPDALALHAALADFVARGADSCTMEVSSIGLAEQRVGGVVFAVAVLTNLTRDHLDYHGSMAAYAEAKIRLFEMPGLRAAVLNLDDELGRSLAARLQGRLPTLGYTLQGRRGTDQVLAAENLQLDAQGLRFELDGVNYAAPLVGRFNAANLLAVIGALRARGEPAEAIAVALTTLSPPPGRMQKLGGEDAPLVVIDYAHTPDALEQVLGVLREVARQRGGELWCVFGCGGERDPGKRPLMGAVAERLADRVVVTSDNPRGEPSTVIIDDILRGMSKSPPVIEDRAAAIAHAAAAAAAADVILLAGKGHESYQEIAGTRMPFSDIEAAKSALVERRGT